MLYCSVWLHLFLLKGKVLNSLQHKYYRSWKSFYSSTHRYSVWFLICLKYSSGVLWFVVSYYRAIWCDEKFYERFQRQKFLMTIANLTFLFQWHINTHMYSFQNVCFWLQCTFSGKHMCMYINLQVDNFKLYL